MSHRIGVVDDDVHIRNIVEGYLQNSGYRTVGLGSTEEALKLWSSDPPDAWLIDIMLPGENGYELCKRLRSESEIPIIMISALSEDEDRIAGIELGADDFMSKPFSPKELVARVNRLMQRHEMSHNSIGNSSRLPSDVTKKETDTVRTLGGATLKLFEDDHSVSWRGLRLVLTAKEFSLLQYLMERPNESCSREDIILHVWGRDSVNSDRAIDQVVKRIRKKLIGLEIDSIWGYGYRLRFKEVDR